MPASDARPHSERIPKQLGLVELVLKTVAVHTVTYFVAGVSAAAIFHYGSTESAGPLSAISRPITDPLVMAGPLLQPIRGVVFALAFYPIRSVVFARPYGWLILWWILVAIGVLSTFGPAPGSIEGMIYTTVPFDPLNVEVEVQALALSGVLWFWVLNPHRKWVGWLIWSSFAVIVALLTLGLLTKAGVFPS